MFGFFSILNYASSADDWNIFYIWRSPRDTFNKSFFEWIKQNVTGALYHPLIWKQFLSQYCRVWCLKKRLNLISNPAFWIDFVSNENSWTENQDHFPFINSENILLNKSVTVICLTSNYLSICLSVWIPNTLFYPCIHVPNFQHFHPSIMEWDA